MTEDYGLYVTSMMELCGCIYYKLRPNFGQTSFKFLAASAWNKVPRERPELRTLAKFFVVTFTYLMNMERANYICKSSG